MVILILACFLLPNIIVVRGHDEVNWNASDFVLTSFPQPTFFSGSASIVRGYFSKGPVTIKPDSRNVKLNFDIDPTIKQEVVKAAEIHLTTTHIRMDEKCVVKVFARDVVEPQINRTQPNLTIGLLGSSFIGPSNIFKFEKLNFDITSVVGELSLTEKFEVDHIVTLQVQCLDLTGNQTCLFNVFDFELIKPVLLIYSSEKDAEETATGTTTPDSERRRRRSRDQSANQPDWPKGPCKRHVMRVNFDALGWSEWIVAPTQYDAYFCYGRCELPLSAHMNSTSHAVMHSLYSYLNPDAVPGPCCVPTKFEPLSVFSRDDTMEDSPVRQQTFEKMIVSECGCR